MAQDQMQRTPGGSVPVPDPTVLTSRQLEAAMSVLTDRMMAADAAIKESIENRFGAIERATDLRQRSIEQIPEMIRQQVAHEHDLIMAKFAQQDEKFHSIQTQFTDNSSNVDKIAGLSKVAVDSAFASSEKAIGKSDQNTSNLIAQQGEAQRSQKDAIDRSLSDLKDRLTQIEARQIGQVEAKRGISDLTGIAVGVAGLVIAAIAFFARRRDEPQIRYIQVPPQTQSPGVTTTTSTSQV